MKLNKLEEFLEHEGFLRYFKNVSWLFLWKIAKAFSVFVVGVWVVRYLGPERFGIFSYTQSFVGLFAAIAALGLDAVVVRELVKYPEKSNELIGTSFFLKLAGAAVVFFMLLVAVQFTDNDYETNGYILIVGGAIIFQSLNVVDFYFQSKVLSKYVVYAGLISISIVSVAKLWLVFIEAPLLFFVWLVFFEAMLFSAGLLYFFFKYSDFSFEVLVFDKKLAVSLLKDCWPLIFGSVAASIYMQVDQVMIKSMLGAQAVGHYAVAVNLTTVWFVITVIITSSVAPSIVAAKKNSRALFLRRLQSLYDLLFKLAVIVIVAVSFLSTDLVLFLYGEEYLKSVKVLNVYIWSLVFVFFSNASWLYYINEGLERLAGVRLVLGAVLNVLLNYFFIERFGLIGGACATLMSYFVSSYFVNYMFLQTKENFVLQTKSMVRIFNIKTWVNPIYLKGDES